MRILLIHQAFSSPQEPGGTRHYELALHCLEQGHQFTVVASDTSYLTGQRVTAHPGLMCEESIDGVRVLRAYAYPGLHRSFLWRVVSFLSFMLTSVWAGLHAGPIDLVMGTSPPIFQALSAWLVASLRRKPFLLEIRDLWPEFAIGLGVLKNPVLIVLSRWLELFLYARANHILINSPAYRDYLLGKGISPAKISLIANGVDPDMFDQAETGASVRRELGLDGRFVVVYTGALGLANDIPTILRAANRLRDSEDIRFLLVGDGKERSNLEALAQQLGVSHVTFAGSRPKSDIPAILAASDVCVATLKDIAMFRTTYPNKVFDYMAAGRPTVLAIDGVIRQVVETADAGVFVRPGDDAALADAILGLYSNPAAVQRMGKTARSYVVRHFNRHIQADEFVKLLQMVSRRQSAPLKFVKPTTEISQHAGKSSRKL